MQSQLAAPLRGWQVSALAFLKALGNQIDHCSKRARAHTDTHTYRSQEAPLVRTHRASDSAFGGQRIKRRRAGLGADTPGSSQTTTPYYSQSLSPHMVSPRRSHSGLGTPTPHQIPRSPGLSPHSQIDRPTVPSLPSTLFKLPKKRTFPTRAENFFLVLQCDRHETGSAATATRFAQRRAGGGRPYLAAALPGGRPAPVVRDPQ